MHGRTGVVSQRDRAISPDRGIHQIRNSLPRREIQIRRPRLRSPPGINRDIPRRTRRLTVRSPPPQKHPTPESRPARSPSPESSTTDPPPPHPQHQSHSGYPTAGTAPTTQTPPDRSVGSTRGRGLRTVRSRRLFSLRVVGRQLREVRRYRKPPGEWQRRKRSRYTGNGENALFTPNALRGGGIHSLTESDGR